MLVKEKNRDNIWLVRKLLSRPNYAVIRLLIEKSPRTVKELYALLGKKFTRKTLILTLRSLSIELNVLQPVHIRTESGYGLGYNIDPKIKEIVKNVEKFEKIMETLAEK